MYREHTKEVRIGNRVIGGGKNRTFGKRTWLWKLCKGRDYA